MTISDDQKQKSARRTILALFALFLIPVLAAVFLNSRWTDWAPSATKNHGELLEPTQVALEPDPAQPWVVVYSCPTDCEAFEAGLEGVHRAMGRHQEDLAMINRDLLDRGTEAIDADGAYILDPRRFLIMRHAHPVDLTGLRKDLNRLLKYTDRQLDD